MWSCALSRQITVDYKQEALTINIPPEVAQTSGSPRIGTPAKGCVHECSSCSRKGSNGKHAAPIAFAIRYCGGSEKRPGIAVGRRCLMLRFPNVLFPVDFSDPCIHTAAYVAGIARKFASRVTLLHAFDAYDP